MDGSKTPYARGAEKGPGKRAAAGAVGSRKKGWSRPRRLRRTAPRKLENITVVDDKKQKFQALLWFLKWVVGIPLAVYILWWFILIVAEAFI